MGVRDKLTEFVEGLEVISTHEHHREDAFHAGLTLETLLANSYVGWCGVPSGQSESEHARFLEEVRYNTYFVWLEKALQKLYRFEEPITAENWEEVSGRIASAHRKNPDRHLDILRNDCRYVADIQDSYDDPGSDRGHPDLFKPAYRINMFLYGYHPEAADHNGNNPLVMYEERPATFSEYLDFVEVCIRRARSAGCVALKSALAYDRSIEFGEPSRDEAAQAWGRHPDELTEAEKLAFGDYVFNHILDVALRTGLPMQVHTGLGLIAGSNPLHFISTLSRHRQVRFDLFHGGYPWTSVIAGISHDYYNVWLDLCWLPLISTTAAVRALHEWLDVVGSCGRILWGADTWTAEESYGALLAARHVITRVLADRVREGLTDPDGARNLARKILHDNAEKLFGL